MQAIHDLSFQKVMSKLFKLCKEDALSFSSIIEQAKNYINVIQENNINNINNLDWERGYTCLHYACRQKNPNVELIQLLLDKKANPNIQDRNSGMTILHTLCTVNDENTQIIEKKKIIKILLKAQADPTIQARDTGLTPLHDLCQQENADVNLIKYLLDVGCKDSETVMRANVTTRHGLTPLHYACHQKKANIEIIKLLLKRQAKVNAEALEYNLTPLHFLCENPNEHNLSAIKYLITEYEVDPQRVTCDVDNDDFKDKYNALHWALRHYSHDSSMEVIKFLFKHVEVNALASMYENYISVFCQSPLFTKCFEKEESGDELKIITFLLENGVDPRSIAQQDAQKGVKESKDVFDINSLSRVSLYTNNIEVIRCLLNAKVDPNNSTTYDYPPLACFLSQETGKKRYYNPEIAMLLLEHGADPNDQETEVPYLLSVVMRRNKKASDYQLIHLLLEKKAKVDAVVTNSSELTFKNKTSLQFALEYKDLRLILLLLWYKAKVPTVNLDNMNYNQHNESDNCIRKLISAFQENSLQSLEFALLDDLLKRLPMNYLNNALSHLSKPIKTNLYTLFASINFFHNRLQLSKIPKDIRFLIQKNYISLLIRDYRKYEEKHSSIDDLKKSWGISLEELQEVKSIMQWAAISSLINLSDNNAIVEHIQAFLRNYIQQSSNEENPRKRKYGF